MTDEPLYTQSEIARETGKESNHKLLRGLARIHGIKSFRVGHVVAYDQEGKDALVRAVREWDSRPRLTGARTNRDRPAAASA